MSLFAQRLIEIDDALTAAHLPHAFGGAIALAYCTQEPRSPGDLDVNVFAVPSRSGEVLAALPGGVKVAAESVEQAERDGQVRVWWEETPIDVFLDVLRFHHEVARTVRRVPFADRTIPVVSCTTLAVFKATFDRTRHWADIEAMVEAGSLDVSDALVWIAELVGAGAPATERMAALGGAA